MLVRGKPRQGRRPAGRRYAAVFPQRRRMSLGPVAAGALALASSISPATVATWHVSAGATVARLSGPTPELWPKLAPFNRLTVVNMGGGTNLDQLAATTLEGAYNQQQRPNRLYVVWNSDDQTWLNDNVLREVTYRPLPSPVSGPDGQLDAMLTDYGRDIKGAIVINPSDPDTLNLATTMAGIDDAMVVDPSQLPLLHRHGIPVIYSFTNMTFASPTGAYQWALTNLFPQTNPADLVMLNPAAFGGLRDYIVATKSFVFYLTSANSAQTPLMNQIISGRPVNTPILGYIANEGADVAALSSIGHFLNASDFLENGSDWAAVPGLRGLRQHQPQALRADKNTVYVAFLVSDGDNAQYDEHRMFDVWTAGTDLGVVPEGWTTAPGMIDFAPSLINWFFKKLPDNSELLTGPSGVGYATQMTGPDLRQFARLSAGFMGKEDMNTVDFWENPDQIRAYARVSGVPSLSVNAPLAYEQVGKTAVFGQTSGYVDPAPAMLSTIEQDVLATPTSDPVFLEPLVDGWSYAPRSILAMAQALTSWGKTVGKKFVFTTPSQLALTQEAYHSGSDSALPPLNAQAVPGSALLALPSAGQIQGYTTPVVTGQDLISNPSGADGTTTGWTDTAGTVTAGTYNSGPDINWSVSANAGTNSADPATTQQSVHVYPAVTNGDTYQFAVQVAGSGQVYMDVYNGTTDMQSPAINLTRNYQTLTWTATIPSNAPAGQTGNAPQLQIRGTGTGAVRAHIQNATVRLATCGGTGGTACMPAMTRNSRIS
jgi:hypothetical protein